MKQIALPPFFPWKWEKLETSQSKLTDEFSRILSAIQFARYVLNSTEHQRTHIYLSRFARMSKETSLAAEKASASACNAGANKRISEILKPHYFGSCRVSWRLPWCEFWGGQGWLHLGECSVVSQCCATGSSWMGTRWQPRAEMILQSSRGHHGPLSVLWQ